MSKDQIHQTRDAQRNGEPKNFPPKNSVTRPTISQGLKQKSKARSARNVSSEPEHRKTEKTLKTPITKAQPRKIQVGSRMKGGVKVIQNSGDFLGRLGTLVVMVVTMISTGVVTVSSFVEGVYWKFGLLAALLLFVHLPVTIAMVWMMCKARVKSIYKKVRPAKTADDQTIIVEADEEKDEVALEADDDPAVVTSRRISETRSNSLTHRGSVNKGFEENDEN